MVEPEHLGKRIFRIASRSSQLALSQTNEVIDRLVAEEKLKLTRDDFVIVPISNAEGDKNLKDPLYAMGETGVFTKQVEIELKTRRADIAVHSLKDMPTISDPELTIASIPDLKPRGDVVLMAPSNKGKTLATLKEGGRVGSSSLRRMANLGSRHPHLQFVNIRGNLNTRLRKLEEGEYDAIVLAHAGVKRLGWEDKIDEFLDPSEYLYAPGQGALGLQCRLDDQGSIDLLKSIENSQARAKCEAERWFLNRLEGGCKLPIAVFSEVLENEKLRLVGQVWSLDGKISIKDEITGEMNDPELGNNLSEKLKAKGAAKILEEIRAATGKK